LDQPLPWPWEGGMISPMDGRIIIFLVAILLVFFGVELEP
jgi:hypothetical protein